MIASPKPSDGARSALDALDHLVLATPDLAATISNLADRLGVLAAIGGQHHGRGTRNALIALSDQTYLEIIGPDPDQPEPQAPRWFRVDSVTSPRLVGWAIKGADLTAIRAEAHGRGVPLGPVLKGNRQRPDGVQLSWEFTDPTVVLSDGVVPFLIDWGATPHPAAAAPHGPTLSRLHAIHPDSLQVQGLVSALGVSLEVHHGATSALIATLHARGGEIELS